MSNDDDTWKGRLIELSHVIADPFLVDLNKFHSKDLTSLLDGINDITTDQLFKEIIIKSLNESMFKPIIPQDELKRRSEVDLQSNKTKLQKLEQPTAPTQPEPPVEPITTPTSASLPSEPSIPSSQISQLPTPPATIDFKKQSQVTSLKTQSQVTEEELEIFLNKNLKDLEILSVPEHYPTKPQNVTSLAELYYLTQTLPLIKLLPGSHKVLMTENFESALLEGKIAVLYSRIEELKRQGKWSLRQPIKFNDPIKSQKRNRRRLFHWDNLLKEAKWMSEDFREGTKYKKYCCVLMAEAVEEYWKLGKDATCIKRKEIQFLPEDKPDEIIIDNNNHDPPTINTELLTENNQEPPQEPTPEQTPKPETTKKPSPFKSFIDLDYIKKIDQSIIKNIPTFTAFDDDEKISGLPLKPRSSPITPVSRLIYPFEQDDNWYKIVLKDFENEINKSSGPPEYQKGLFGLQRRFNYLKPPKPPLIKNIDYRSPTIWLPQDDKRLIHYVAEYCFNWDLIAEHLSPNSSAVSLKKYESNIERRTPWQCFERYIQLNEKFQFHDMKGVYSYHAQQWLEQAHRAQSTTKRRISPLGVGTESIQRGHRKLRWASLFDAIRKTMKKREIQAAKLNHRKSTTDYQQNQNQQTNSQQGSPVPESKRNVERIATPAELSKLKLDRDKSIREAHLNDQATRNRMMAAVAQQQNQHRNAVLQQQQNHSPPNQNQNHVSVLPKAGIVRQGSQPITSQPVPNSNIAPAVGNQNFQRMSNSQTPQPANNQIQNAQIPNKQTTTPSNNQIPIKRPTTPNGTPLTNEQIQQLIQIQKQRRLLQAQQVQQAQQAQQQQQQAQQQVNPQMRNNTTATSPNINMQPQPTKQMNQTFNQQNQQKQSTNNQQQAQARPRFNFPQAQVSAIIHTIQQQNPTFTREQVTKLAAQYLAGMQQQQQQQQRMLQRQNSQAQNQNQNQNQSRLSPQQMQQIQQRNSSSTSSPNLQNRQPQQQMLMNEGNIQMMQSNPSSPNPLSRQLSNQSGSPISGSPNLTYNNNVVDENSNSQ
ncbi:unnamed protein product [Candida verbasci]|uniref:Chromatin modification-related protein EAF1 n=1 Tax=Candida verbasci TaxID=1227364 RepID=A0A9W4TZF9_9ASCO|nr:unnamed protein product [Candida verbasci]